ncbi:MAG: LCP family protein [Chloroflexi bacterium]|nr:LCP family protein [Chloroflexota bacterium]
MNNPRRQRRGCSTGLVLALFIALMLPVFACGLMLVTYLVFPPPHLDILVLGLDAREGEGALTRADSVMLVGVDPAHLRVSVLSIPRDVFIEVPNYGLQRINTINLLGEQEATGRGPALLGDALEQSFGVRPKRYIRLDFAAFVELVDAVGGIAVDVERTIIDDFYPTADGGITTIRFDSGVQYLDGERALQYVRTRYADDDYRRAERQQQVLASLVQRLANPLNWPAALDVLRRRVDSDLSLFDLLSLAPPVLLSGGRFDQLVLNRDYLLGTAEGNAVPDYEKVKSWLAGRFE